MKDDVLTLRVLFLEEFFYHTATRETEKKKKKKRTFSQCVSAAKCWSAFLGCGSELLIELMAVWTHDDEVTFRGAEQQNSTRHCVAVELQVLQSDARLVIYIPAPCLTKYLKVFLVALRTCWPSFEPVWVSEAVLVTRRSPVLAGGWPCGEAERYLPGNGTRSSPNRRGQTWTGRSAEDKKKQKKTHSMKSSSFCDFRMNFWTIWSRGAKHTTPPRNNCNFLTLLKMYKNTNIFKMYRCYKLWLFVKCCILLNFLI